MSQCGLPVRGGGVGSIVPMVAGTASRVPGRAGGEIIGTGAQGGWHWVEWICEFAGTALLLLGGLSAICLDFAPGSPVVSVVPDHSARLLITGLLFAGVGSLVAVSPLGRRCGAHLNPSVTVAFWRRGHMHPHETWPATSWPRSLGPSLVWPWCVGGGERKPEPSVSG